MKISLVLVAMTLVAFYRVAGHQFLTYDDGEYVTDNPQVNAGLTVSGIVWAFTKFHAANWHPLTWISHMVDCSLFRRSPVGPHLVNLLFHVANTVLLFLLLARMTGAIWRSGFVAALFAIHPLHVESVAWVAERKDVLSTLFWILTMWAYVRYAEFKVQGSRFKVGAYVSVIVLFALGLMAKPMLVTLPFVLLLLDYWPLGRFGASPHPNPLPLRGCTGEGKGEGSGFRVTRYSLLVIEKLPLLALAIASSIMTYLAQRTEAVSSLERIPMAARISNALISYAAYIWKMLWPRELAGIYPHPAASLPAWQVICAAALLIAVSVVVLWAAKRRPYIIVGWLWYLGTLVPVIGLIQVGGQAMADRYTYVPLIGLFMIAGWGIPDLVGIAVRNGRKGERENGRAFGQAAPIPPFSHSPILPFSAAIALLALTVCAWVQVGYWRNTVTLFHHALSVTERNYLAHSFLGATLAINGKHEEAVRHLEASLRIRPDYAASHSDIGFSLAQQGKYGEAAVHFQRALELEPAFAQAHYNLGLCFAKVGRLQEAIEHLEQALQIRPDMQAAQEGLEKLRDALASGQAGSTLPTDKSVEHYRRATELHSQGRLDEAIEEYRQAIQVNPQLAQAHSNLGLAYKDKGDSDAAIREYREAIRLKPDLAQAHGNLAIELYLKGHYAEAWSHVKLCRKYGLTPHPDFVKALSEKMPEPP